MNAGRSLLAALCMLASAPSHAQDRVYRCGSSYASTPCPVAVAVEVADARSAAQRQEALQVAARDAQLAEALSRERRQREAAGSRQGANHIGPSRTASAPEKSQRSKAPRKGDSRRAHDDARLTPPLKILAPAG